MGERLSRLTIPYLALGRNEEAEAASRESIEILESLPPGRELARAFADQAYARMLSRDNDEGVTWGREGRRCGAAVGDRDVEAYGLNMVGTSLIMAGRIEREYWSCSGASCCAGEAGHEVRTMSALNMLGSGLGEM